MDEQNVTLVIGELKHSPRKVIDMIRFFQVSNWGILELNVPPKKILIETITLYLYIVVATVVVCSFFQLLLVTILGCSIEFLASGS